jgi:AcrR family transcriptional regulator
MDTLSIRVVHILARVFPVGSGGSFSDPSSRRSGRGAAARNGDLEAAICAAAERLMAERPYAELSVADVLEEAGVSRASFYFYFASKDALLARLGERIATDVYGTTRTWFDGDDGAPRYELRAAVAGALAVWTEHAGVQRAVVEAGPQDAETSAFWQRRMQAFIGASARRIERDRRRGLAPPGPEAQPLAAALMWMTERALYQQISGGDPAFAEPEVFIDTLTDVWWRAIYAPSA